MDLKAPEKEFVAVKNGEVLGILSLRYHGQAEGLPTPNISTWKLFKKYGIISIIKALILDKTVTYHPSEGELYIDSIGVARDARGNGVGTVLMNFADDFAKEKGLKRITLNVMFENPRAKALYEKLGFSAAKTEHFPKLKKATGYSGAYFMIKNI